MRRLLKWVFYSALALIVLLLVAFGTAYYYKQEIFAVVKEELKKNINGEIDFSDITINVIREFPAVSVTLHDLSIRGPHYEEFHRDFLSAKKVYVRVKLTPLFFKRVEIESILVTQAEVFVFKSRTGQTNLDVFRRKDVSDTVDTGKPVDISFDHIRLQDVGVFYRDSIKNKMVGFRCVDVENRIQQTDSSLRYRITGKMFFEGLTLSQPKGSYLKGKEAEVDWDLESVLSSRRLIVHDSKLGLEKSTVNLSGDFHFGDNGKFNLTISSERLNYYEGLSLLTESLQSKLNHYVIDNYISIVTRLDGPLSQGEPSIDISFEFEESPVKIGSTDLGSITAVGKFSNHRDSLKNRDDRNSVLTIMRADGSYRGFPMHAEVTISDLTNPSIDLIATTDFDLRELWRLEDTTNIKFRGGRFTSRVDYSGTIEELMDTTVTKYKGKLAGSARIRNGFVHYVPRSHEYKNVNLSVHFNQERVLLDTLSFTLNTSPVLMTGSVEGFVPFFVQPKGKGSVRLNVSSPSLDLASVLAKNPKASAAKTPDKKPSRSTIRSTYEKVEFQMNVQIGQLQYNNLKGSNLTGSVKLANNKLSAHNFKMKLAGGDVAFSLTVFRPFSSSSWVFVEANVRKADVPKFFYAFDNFKLKSITHKNLEGKLDTYATFGATVNDEFAIYVPSVVSKVDLTLRQGRIIDFEPLQNMSNFLLKKRDFHDVHFGEIKSQLSIRGTEIDIRKMEIESTVLRLFVEGRYSLKDSTNLSVQVPLSNLKKRDKNYKPENVGVDAKVGPSVFLHVYEDDKGKIQIAYDPFKKYAHKSNNKKGKSK